MTIKMKILLLDNYDSFTYNLLHAVKELGATDVEVVRNSFYVWQFISVAGNGSRV